MRLLITGGAGFIGSHLVSRWTERRAEDSILNLDKLTYAADLEHVSVAAKNPGYRLEKIDLADRPAVRHVVRDFRPDGVIHLAAESHVDNSIHDPELFVLTNVLGTFNLLEECRQLWLKDSAAFSRNRFHHVSTDEVYGALKHQGAFSEQDRCQPNSPYSATKAASDHLVRAYYRTYKMNVVITNCSNNFGPRQHVEKLIPTVIRSALAHQPIPVYGKGENVRDWLYVGDHCEALEKTFFNGRAGESYNIGGRNEWKNIDLVRKLCDILNEMVGKGPESDYKKLISFVKDRPGHDFRYAIHPEKIESELGWKASRDFDRQLQKTVAWYVEKFKPTSSKAPA